MACYLEEECDWSDGSLDPRSPEYIEPPAGPSGSSNSIPQHDVDDLFVSEPADDGRVAVGSPLPITFEDGKHDPSIPSRAQRAQLGIHLNRRQPSRDDYANFAIYQANQKVYEVTCLKNFVAHALHPDRLAQCFADGAPYLRSVLQNINGMADKMIFTAHSRTVNLLANDGRDGVPFLDTHSFNRKMFSDFGADNAISVVGRLSGSWHRVTPGPAMMRMSTKQYPIGASSSPLEEIDEVAHMFSDKALNTLPTGRPKKQGKARVRAPRRDEPRHVTSRGNWLAFPPVDVEMIGAEEESQTLCEGRQDASTGDQDATAPNHFEGRQDTPTRIHPTGLSWRMRLVQDHRRRLNEKFGPPKQKAKAPSAASSNPTTPLPTTPHPSGSKILELHQILPPDAYFTPREPDEKPAWRCGIQHAMGHYYNAGNRKGCPGCFVNIRESAKTKHMDFYLPPSSHFFQPAPELTYTPSKPSNKARRSKTLSHNSIAKEAYWAAINAGADAGQARLAGVSAVETVLRRRAPKEPTPTPTPSPPTTPLPHPSGSTTLEHTQDLPFCATFTPPSPDAEPAWRCDVNHALGRYYLSGDKRSCPGCGSNRSSESKKAVMDFWMPDGVVVRQDAPGLSSWKPRKPNKTTSKGKGTKQAVKKVAKKEEAYLTHNQICSRKYFEALENEPSLEHNEALRRAIDALEEDLEEKARAMEWDEEDEEDVEEPEASGHRTTSLVPRKRSASEIEEESASSASDPSSEDIQVYASPWQLELEQSAKGTASSDDEDEDDTSGSDSE